MGQPQRNNSIVTRFQRNIFSKLSKPSLVKHVLSDNYVSLLDIMHSILSHYHSTQIADKVIKNIVKIVVKLALVFSDEKQLDEHEHALDDLQDKFRTLLLTIHSFDQVKYSYSQPHLLKLMKETEESMLVLVKPILSDNSSTRVQLVFQHFTCNTQMLDNFFQSDSPHLEERTKFMEVIADLQF